MSLKRLAILHSSPDYEAVMEKWDYLQGQALQTMQFIQSGMIIDWRCGKIKVRYDMIS